MAQKPNIVIFNPDHFRYNGVHHLGNPAAVTPNLDRLVQRDGVSFRNAFCQNTVCTPSRCSFMSGWYPHVRGHRTMFHMMHEDEPVLLKTLKDHGYFVWWGGKNDLVPGQGSFEPYCHVKHEPAGELRSRWGRAQESRGEPGDDTYYSFYHGRIDKGDADVYYDSDWDNVTAAVDLIRGYDRKEPLCIYLPLTYPHQPYAVEEPWYSIVDRAALSPRVPTPEGWETLPSMLKWIYDRQGLQGWTEERWNELRATYYGMCSRIDHQLGLVLTALQDAGIYDETAVFFFSDHGEFAGDYGVVDMTQNTFQDSLTHVPLVIKPPAWVPTKPRVSDALVELVDFPATVEALTCIDPGHTHFGRSLVPVLRGETDEHRDAVFSEGGRLHGETHCMELESPQDTTSPYWPRLSAQRSEGPEHTKAVMIRTEEHKYVRRLYESDELYDLSRDPMELENRIDDPALATELLRLKERMLTFFLETGDVVPHQTDRRF